MNYSVCRLLGEENNIGERWLFKKASVALVSCVKHPFVTTVQTFQWKIVLCYLLKYEMLILDLQFFELEGCILHGILFNFPVKKGI